MIEGEQLGHWLAARAGKLTASRMCDAMAFLKNGKPGEARSKYMRELLAERVTGLSIRHYVTPAMEWGMETEAEAKKIYQVNTGNVVRESWFYDHPQIDMFGATPDGELADGGLIECKCPTTGTFMDWVLADEIPEQHQPQLLAQLACTGRTWVDFVAYDPRVKRGPNIIIRRYQPTRDEIDKVEAAATAFLKELDTMFELFVARAA